MTDGIAAWAGNFFQGWRELAALFVVLLLASLLMGWLSGRRSRPSDRGPALNAPLFLAAFGLLLLARYLHEDHLSAMIIAGGLAIAGVISAKSGTRAPVLVTIMLAVLLGFSLHLSAIVLFLASTLMLSLSRSATNERRSSR